MNEHPDESGRLETVFSSGPDRNTDVLIDWQRPPVVGIVASETNADAVARTVLRAQQYGHDVLVLYSERSSPESVAFARQVGARLVEVDTLPDSTDAARQLTSAARDAGFPGLIFNGYADAVIDYEATGLALSESDAYGVDAIARADDPDHPAANVVVGIPAYNEGSTIEGVVSIVAEHAGSVIVVDDGSADDTAVRAERAGATVIRHPENRGYGGALRTLFSEAARRNVDHLVIIDGDGQHDSMDIPRLVDEQVDSGADIVIGSRFAADGDTDAPLYRRFGLFVINTMTNASLGTLGRNQLTDTQSGFRAYNRAAIRSLAADPTIGQEMSASTDILYHAKRHGYRVREIGTSITYDVEHGSSQDPISHGMNLLSNIVRAMRRDQPGLVFGLPGLFAAVCGMFVLTAVLSGATLVAPWYGVALALGAQLALLGSLACLYGLVSHSLNARLKHTSRESHLPSFARR